MSLQQFNPKDFFNSLNFQPSKMLVTEIMLNDGTFTKMIVLLDNNLDDEVINIGVNQSLNLQREKWFYQKTQGYLIQQNNFTRFANYVTQFSDGSNEWDYEQ